MKRSGPTRRPSGSRKRASKKKPQMFWRMLGTSPRARALKAKGKPMTPFIVRVRTSAAAGHSGSMVLYVAVVESETEAVAAVRSTVPRDWQVEDVIGHALPSLVERRKIGPGKVEQL